MHMEKHPGRKVSQNLQIQHDRSARRRYNKKKLGGSNREKEECAMKKIMGTVLILMLAAGILVGCGEDVGVKEPAPQGYAPSAYEGVRIRLSDEGVTVDEPQPEDGGASVVVGGDIVYYEAGRDFTYGEGEKDDEHSKEEATEHTLVTITKPGTYILSGKLSKGQIAVDLGEDAKKDPEAVVTLVLDNVDIVCTVAPAVIFYNVYECGSKDGEDATATVDTSSAGANVVIADGSVSNISGSYVARIYKPESVELSEDGRGVVDAKKLHKYDAAFYSKMSMNISGNDGVLNIFGENEGLDSELHLTLNGGTVNIESGNDGINTNEDGVSVTTVNGGSLNIRVNGSTGEGDGIDSNGWLVINGGTVVAQGCGFSMDAGIDSDMGIHINGGTVIATGNMLDRIGESKQNFAVFQFSGSRKDGQYILKNEKEEVIVSHKAENSFQYLLISAPELKAGEYTLWDGETRLQGTASEQMGGFGGFGGQMPEFAPENMPGGMTPPEGMEGEWPQGEMPEGQMPGDFPGGMGRPGSDWGQQDISYSDIFKIEKGENYFQGVTGK